MSNTEQQLASIEITLEQAQAAVAARKALQTLTKNPEFKELVLEGYFEKEASRVVLLRADPSMQDELNQKDLDNQIVAIGYLRQYLSGIMIKGRTAEKAIQDCNETREEILAEDRG